MLGWPPLLVHADEVAGSLVGKLLLSAAPTVLFLVILFDRLGWKYLLGNTLAIAMVVVACTVESMRWMLEMDLSTASLSSWWSRRADADVWSDSVWLCLTLVAAGAITSWVLPYWMIWVTGSGSMEPSFAEHIRGWWLRAGVKPPRVLLWPTGCRYSNAAIVQGLGGKRLLITDRLLLNYTMPQIEWIVLHEIAHVCRFHSWVRLIPAWIAVPSLLGALQAFEGWSLVAVILAIALVFGVLIMATCWWTEIDADRTAIRMGERWMGLSREAAAAQYVDVLRRIYRDNRLERTSWTHPSLEQRIAPYKTLASCGIP
jgi:Zn-dependent protease with chaperone function